MTVETTYRFFSERRDTTNARRTAHLHKKKKDFQRWNWGAVKNIDFHHEGLREASAEQEVAESGVDWDIWWWETQTLIIPMCLGVLIATCGYCLDLAVYKFNTWRYGFCGHNPWYSFEVCCGNEPQLSFQCQNATFYRWTDFFLGGRHMIFDHAFDLIVSLVFVMISVYLVKIYAPEAKSSGVPEIKAVLNGVRMPRLFWAITGWIKFWAISLAVATGMSLGKEGPLVHIAGAMSGCLARLTDRYRNSQRAQLELLATSTAAGVSVAFGAPLGGVLFAVEEMSTIYSERILIRCFIASASAAFTTLLWDPFNNGKLTLFQVDYTESTLSAHQLITCAIIGVLGGLWGVSYIWINVGICCYRLRAAFRAKCSIPLEIFVIALGTFLLNWTNSLCIPLPLPTVHRLLTSCDDWVGKTDELGLCDTHGQDMFSWEIVGMLFIASWFRLLQSTFTFGTGIAAGAIIPALFAGAAMGRCIGVLSVIMANQYGYHEFASEVNPALYAMIGAAAALNGWFRASISCVVIMVELTGSTQFVVPFMITILCSRLTADAFTLPLYECQLVMRRAPFLPHSAEDGWGEADGTAGDVVDRDLECVAAEEPHTLKTLRNMINTMPDFKGFPLVLPDSLGSHLTYAGFLYRQDLINQLEECSEYPPDTRVYFLADYAIPGGISFESVVDDNLIRVNSDCKLNAVHGLFISLGLRMIIVVDQGRLQGLLTKKTYIKHYNCWTENESRPWGVCQYTDRDLHPGNRTPLAKSDRWNFDESRSCAASRNLGAEQSHRSSCTNTPHASILRDGQKEKEQNVVVPTNGILNVDLRASLLKR